ncbi:unnamed protein product [Sphagnum troendelagicum]
MTTFLFSQEISCNNLLTTSDKAQILRPLADFATNMTNLAEVQKTLRDRRETKERNRTYILKKKARTAENLKGMKTWRHRRGTEREQNIFSTKKARIAENMKGSKRNTTESPKESKNCRKREEIEEEQKRTEEPLLEKKAPRSQIR